MIPENCIFIAVLINVFAISFYIRDTLKGKTQPNRVTWLIWGLAPLIATAAQLKGGAGLPTMIVFLSGFWPLIVFFCSFTNKNAYWKTTLFDCVCGALAAIGLGAWYLTKNQDYAIAFSILTDLCAAIPTYKKSYTHPESETGLTFVIAIFSDGIALLCVQEPSFTAYAFLGYLFCVCLSLALLIYRKKLAHWFSLGFVA